MNASSRNSAANPAAEFFHTFFTPREQMKRGAGPDRSAWPSEKMTSVRRGYSPIPHRKREGELVFEKGELREWIRENGALVEGGRPERGHLRESPRVAHASASAA